MGQSPTEPVHAGVLLRVSFLHPRSFFHPQLPPLQISMGNDDVKRKINMIWIQELEALGIEMENLKVQVLKTGSLGFSPSSDPC